MSGGGVLRYIKIQYGPGIVKLEKTIRKWSKLFKAVRLGCKKKLPVLTPPLLCFRGTSCGRTVYICYVYSPRKPVLTCDAGLRNYSFLHVFALGEGLQLDWVCLFWSAPIGELMRQQGSLWIFLSTEGWQRWQYSLCQGSLSCSIPTHGEGFWEKNWNLVNNLTLVNHHLHLVNYLPHLVYHLPHQPNNLPSLPIYLPNLPNYLPSPVISTQNQKNYIQTY